MKKFNYLIPILGVQGWHKFCFEFSTSIIATRSQVHHEDAKAIRQQGALRKGIHEIADFIEDKSL